PAHGDRRRAGAVGGAGRVQGPPVRHFPLAGDAGATEPHATGRQVAAPALARALEPVLDRARAACEPSAAGAVLDSERIREGIWADRVAQPPAVGIPDFAAERPVWWILDTRLSWFRTTSARPSGSSRPGVA